MKKKAFISVALVFMMVFGTVASASESGGIGIMPLGKTCLACTTLGYDCGSHELSVGPYSIFRQQ